MKLSKLFFIAALIVLVCGKPVGHMQPTRVAAAMFFAAVIQLIREGKPS